MIISFIGHSKAPQTSQLKEEIQKTILNYTNKKENNLFYLGGYGNFDHLCACAVKELQNTHHNFISFFITPYFNDHSKQLKNIWESGLYDHILYPPIENTPYRFAICKRNKFMTDVSDLIIAYVKYTWGGAYTSYLYAKQKRKKLINLAESEK